MRRNLNTGNEYTESTGNEYKYPSRIIAMQTPRKLNPVAKYNGYYGKFDGILNCQ